jgi:tetratricopeptide (TPR) repeat protein
MFLSDPQPDKAVEGSLDERPLTADDPLPFEPVLSAAQPPRNPGPRRDTPAPPAATATDEAMDVVESDDLPPTVRGGSQRRADKRWWVLAASSALLLVLLTAGGIWLIAKKPSTVDQFVILTVPSGAEIKLDSTYYGFTPVKLEQVPIGTYTLTITKEGFEPIIESITISDSTPLEFRLKLVAPSDAADLPVEERLKQYQQRAEEAFARGDYAIPFEESALYYTTYILDIDATNQFGLDMREQVRKKLLQLAQSEASRGDMGKAQEIINLLLQHYPKDDEVRAASTRLENQLSSRKGEVQNLVRKAEEALRAGNLTEPYRASAYYYARQALAIDRSNAQAQAIHHTIKERLLTEGERTYAEGEVDSAIKQLDNLAGLFPEDTQIRSRLREISVKRNVEVAKVNDPKLRRLQGLEKYRKEDFAEAIPDLEFAVVNGVGTPDVIFALARSYMKLGRYDDAAPYFLKVPQTADDAYRSARAALGDIAAQRGDTETALERYKQARQLGGSTLYPIPNLDDKIEKIERRKIEKAAEPSPVSIQVKHQHGGIFKGSCSGTLTVGPTGVSYDGEHAFSANLTGVTVRISKDELIIYFQKVERKFKASRHDAERFREALTKYQSR